MAQLKDFFNKVWATSGYFCIATPSENGGYFHKVFQTVNEAEQQALLFAKQGRDCYFALGTLKEPYIQTGELNSYGKLKKFYRVGQNIHAFKCFFFDLDCGEGKPYENQKEAILALKAFVKETKLPKPFIVNSGYGIHAYFTFEQEVLAEDWKPLAVVLKRLAFKLGLEVDPTRTTDTSSVLRVPYTKNFKNNQERPVQLLQEGNSKPFSYFEQLLLELGELHGIQKPEGSQNQPFTFDSQILSLFQNNVDDTAPISMDYLYSKCQQLSYCKETGGPVGYAMRGHWVSIMNQSSDPNYDDLLKDDPKPDVVRYQTEQMLLSSLANNPHSCEDFERENPRGCDGCEFKGKVKNPLGIKIIEIKQEKVSNVSIVDNSENEKKYEFFRTEDGVNHPLPPEPFTLKDKKGVIYNRFDNDELVEEILYPHLCYPEKRLWDSQENCESVKIIVGTAKDGYRDIVLPLTELVEPRSLARRLTALGVLFPTVKTWDMFFNYMTSYVRHLQGYWAATKNYSQLGWMESENAFVLPTKTIRSGFEEPSGLSESIKNSVNGIKKKGTLEAWVNVVNTYARPGFEPHAFGHLVGYGSLLFNFQKYEGAIVNLVSPHSGSGKSTVLQTVETMFGRSKDLRIILSDTLNSKFNRIGVYNSICPTFDEITNIDPEELSEFCYSISQGRAKSRLGQNQQEVKNNAHWKSIMLSSSNANLMNKLSSYKQNATAESMRVFEYYVNETNLLTKEEASSIFDQLDENYGHAGEVFLRYVAANAKTVKALIDKTTKDFDEAANVPVRERYWSSVVACSLTGGMIARDLGLCNYNIKSLFDWAVAQVTSMRSIVEQNKVEEVDVLVQYLNDTLGNTIRVGENKIEGKGYVSLMDESRISRLFNRLEVDSNYMFIERQKIRDYIQRRHLDYNVVKSKLIADKILIKDSVNKVLTAGSNLVSSGSCRCWLVDMNHREMSGAKLQLVKTEDNETSRSYDFGD